MTSMLCYVSIIMMAAIIMIALGLTLKSGATGACPLSTQKLREFGWFVHV